MSDKMHVLKKAFKDAANLRKFQEWIADKVEHIDASQITSGVFDVARIPNLDASKITSGVFDLARIPNIDWSRISGNFPRAIGDLISSAFSRSWISDFFSSPFWPNIPDKPSVFPPELHASAHGLGGADQISIDASQTTSGVFSVARIPNLDASKITSGVFDVARIPDLDASKIVSGRFPASRLPTSATANTFLAVRTANADPVYDVLKAADIPDLDASKIVSGRFPVSRLPDGSSGYVLVGQGAGYDMAWKTIDGIAGTITDSQHGTKTGIPFAHHGDWGHYGKIPTSAPTGAAGRAYVDSANLYVHDGISWVLRATKDWNNLINKPSTYPPSTHDRSAHTPGLVPSVTADPSAAEGDFWYRSDLDKLFLYTTATKTVFPAQWGDIEGKPSTFPPSTHDRGAHTVGLVPSLTADPTAAEGDLWYRSDIDQLKLYTTAVKQVFPADWGDITNKPSTFPPSAHASSHNPSGADALAWTALATDLIPDIDITRNLGSSSYRWNKLYTLQVTNPATALELACGTYISFTRAGSTIWIMDDTAFRPSTDNAYDLGSSSYRIRDFYLYGQATLNCQGAFYPFLFVKDVDGADPCLRSTAAMYGTIGDPTNYLFRICSCYVFYKYLSSFEALDDVAILKQMKPKREKRLKGNKKVEVEEEVIDLNTVHPALKDETGELVDLGALTGFLIGVCKKLVDRIEKLEAEIANIKRERI